MFITFPQCTSAQCTFISDIDWDAQLDITQHVKPLYLK